MEDIDNFLSILRSSCSRFCPHLNVSVANKQPKSRGERSMHWERQLYSPPPSIQRLLRTIVVAIASLERATTYITTTKNPLLFRSLHSSRVIETESRFDPIKEGPFVTSPWEWIIRTADMSIIKVGVSEVSSESRWSLSNSSYSGGQKWPLIAFRNRQSFCSC